MKTLKLGENWVKLWAQICFIRQYSASYIKKSKKKISEIGQDQKNLRSVFVSFFNVSAEWGGDCKLGSLPNKIINFSGAS